MRKSIFIIALLALSSCQMAVVNNARAKKTAIDGSSYIVWSVSELSETNIKPCETCDPHCFIIEAYNQALPNNAIYLTTYTAPEVGDTLKINIQ
jgi:hypothetical protein